MSAPALGNDELLARFVLRSSWVRRDGTIRPDAFVPPPNLQLSVSRHTGRSTSELWRRGEAVAAARDVRLVGRADIRVERVRAAKPLNAIADPIEGDPGHALIVGWASEKPTQKMMAMQLAGDASYTPAPS